MRIATARSGSSARTASAARVMMTAIGSPSAPTGPHSASAHDGNGASSDESVEGPHGVGEDPASIVLHSDQGQRGALPCRNGQVLVERGAERVRVPHDQQHPHLNPLFAAGLSVQSGDLGGRFGVGVVDDDQHGSLRTDGGGQDLRRPSRPSDPGRPALWQRTGHLDSETGLARTGGARQHPHGQGGRVGAPRQQLVRARPAC